MSTEVEFAVVGRDMSGFLPLRSFYRDFFNEDEHARPWDEWRRTTLSVEDDETVGSIRGRAIAALDLVERDWSKLSPLRNPEATSLRQACAYQSSVIGSTG